MAAVTKAKSNSSLAARSDSCQTNDYIRGAENELDLDPSSFPLLHSIFWHACMC